MGADKLATVIRSLAGTTHSDTAVLATVLRVGPLISASAPGYSAPIEVHAADSLPELYKGDIVVAIRASGMWVAVALATGSAIGDKARKQKAK